MTVPNANEAVGRTRTLLLLVCGSVLLTLALAEVTLRIGGISYPRMNQRDHWRGTALIPGREMLQRDEGHAAIRINRAGFRDQEWQVEKAPRTVRIAVLGDSYTEARQIDVERRFTNQLEMRLLGANSFGDKNVEVLNFGHSGYGTAQEWLTLRHAAWHYDPDIVIVALLTGNDLRNNNEAIERDPGRPYFVFRGDKLVLDASFRESVFHKRTWRHYAAYWLMDHLRLAQLVHRAYGVWQRRKHLAAQGRGSDSRRPAGEPGLSDEIYTPPRSTEWADAWKVTEAILVEMNKAIRARGAGFLLVVLSNGVQVDPDRQKIQKQSEMLGVEDLHYPDRRLAALGERFGFPVLALAEPFARFAARTRAYLHGFGTGLGRGHWNEEGHQLAAEMIAENISVLTRTTWGELGLER